MFGKGLWLEATALLVIFLGLIKSLITFKNAAFRQIFSVISGPLDQLQIFWQLYLIELLWLLIGLGLLELQHLVYLKLLKGFGKLKSYGISGRVFGLILSYLSNRRPWVFIWKSSQKYPVDSGVLQGYILCRTFFLLSVNDQASNLWQQIELASESNLWDTVDLGRKWFVDCWVGKNQLP